MAGSASGGARHARVTPYLLSLPALAYLAVFFVVPLWALLRTSLSTNTGSVFDPTLSFSWAFSNYGDAFTRYDGQIFRSFEYALTATLLALALAYPLAYVIAFKGGRWKNLLLGLVIVPFFITTLPVAVITPVFMLYSTLSPLSSVASFSAAYKVPIVSAAQSIAVSAAYLIFFAFFII